MECIGRQIVDSVGELERANEMDQN